MNCVYCKKIDPLTECGHKCGSFYCNQKCANSDWFQHKFQCLHVSGKIYDRGDVINHLQNHSDTDEYLDNHIDSIFEYENWELKDVDIRDIDWHQWNVSSKESKNTIAYYKTLKTKYPAVILVPNKYGEDVSKKYRIVDGYHRIAVSISQGKKKIRAFVPVT